MELKKELAKKGYKPTFLFYALYYLGILLIIVGLEKQSHKFPSLISKRYKWFFRPSDLYPRVK